MHWSGEFRYSGRRDEIGEDAFRRIGDVCAMLGLPGLFEALAIARSDHSEEVTRTLMTGITASYRIGADRGSAVAMAVNDMWRRCRIRISEAACRGDSR